MIDFLTKLGIPTLLGALFGFLSSYAMFYLQGKKQDKQEKKNTAKDILAEIYAYNVTAGTEALFPLNFPNATREELLESQNRFTQAAKIYNQMEAIADLFVGEECAKSMEKIKTLVNEIQDEYKTNIANGVVKRNRHELKKGQEYDAELVNIKKILKSWVNR